MSDILVIAHVPLASALRQCVLHVFPDAADAVRALDVPPQELPDETLQRARHLMPRERQVLVLTDLFGATPSNVASRLVDGARSRLVAGVNLPMLLRAVTYRHEALDELVARAVLGGTQGVMTVSTTGPQNQNRRATHDQDHRDHQQ